MRHVPIDSRDRVPVLGRLRSDRLPNRGNVGAVGTVVGLTGTPGAVVAGAVVAGAVVAGAVVAGAVVPGFAGDVVPGAAGTVVPGALGAT